jgi:hypothetical protein
MTQEVEHLPSKHEALSSKPGTAPPKEKKSKNWITLTYLTLPHIISCHIISYQQNAPLCFSVMPCSFPNLFQAYLQYGTSCYYVLSC